MTDNINVMFLYVIHKYCVNINLNTVSLLINLDMTRYYQCDGIRNTDIEKFIWQLFLMQQ